MTGYVASIDALAGKARCALVSFGIPNLRHFCFDELYLDKI